MLGYYDFIQPKVKKLNKYKELTKKLKEIFQIDQPELDFGIYRILNSRSEEINNYLENTLKAKVLSALGGENSKYQNTVFAHLLTFFSRYYDSGDFVSKRRYKGDTYAIPYSGEEVVLHWANKDQYYIKSGENFSNYSFKLEDGRKVNFKLVLADTAKDNRKDNDADRRFVFVEPVDVVDNELVINFEYKSVKKGTKQDALVKDAVSSILSSDTVQEYWIDLTKRAPTEKNPNRTVLERHLATYTQKNTSDYFIHKNLQGFLSNELDFYIKSEVMNLDNIQNAEVFDSIESQLKMIQCLRLVAQDLIAFLAQIENFQKRLWEKKKFVTACDYLITLDHVPEQFYTDICANNAQWEQWKELGIWQSSNIGTEDDLRINLGMAIDTSLFDASFKDRLLLTINNIDKKTNGLLINSDNYHGLNFLKGKYKNSIDLQYIDPPYNTLSSEIIYKNNYKHSSWNTLISNRFDLSYDLLKQSALCFTAIDHEEVYGLGKIMDEKYGITNRVAIVTVQHNPKGRNQAKFFSENSEFLLAYSKDYDKASFNQVAIDDDVLKTFDKSDKIGRYRYENFIRARSNWSREQRPNNWYPIYVSDDLLDITTEKKTGLHRSFSQNG